MKHAFDFGENQSKAVTFLPCSWEPRNWALRGFGLQSVWAAEGQSARAPRVCADVSWVHTSVLPGNASSPFIGPSQVPHAQKLESLSGSVALRLLRSLSVPRGLFSHVLLSLGNDSLSR